MFRIGRNKSNSLDNKSRSSISMSAVTSKLKTLPNVLPSRIVKHLNTSQSIDLQTSPNCSKKTPPPRPPPPDFSKRKIYDHMKIPPSNEKDRHAGLVPCEEIDDTYVDMEVNNEDHNYGYVQQIRGSICSSSDDEVYSIPNSAPLYQKDSKNRLIARKKEVNSQDSQILKSAYGDEKCSSDEEVIYIIPVITAAADSSLLPAESENDGGYETIIFK